MGVGLVAAFAAREVFVSTESIINATGYMNGLACAVCLIVFLVGTHIGF
jgi:hypothetical protein